MIIIRQLGSVFQNVNKQNCKTTVDYEHVLNLEYWKKL